MNRRHVVLFVTALAVVSSLIWVIVRRNGKPDSKNYGQIETAFRQRKFSKCRELADEFLIHNPQSTHVLILAARSATEMGDEAGALRYYAAVPADKSSMGLEAKSTAGQLAFKLGRAREAEAQLRAAREIDPQFGPANGLLAYLLVLEGRYWESLPALFEPIRQGEFPLEHLLLLAGNEPVIDNENQVQLFLKESPDDPLPLLGAARQALRENRDDDAEPILRQIIAFDATSIETQVRLGEVLAKRGNAEFTEWLRSAPKTIEHHPQYWVARGVHAELSGRFELAVRYYWEAARRDSDLRVANQRLGMQLRSLRKDDLALPFLDRAARLERLERIADGIRRGLPLNTRPTTLDAIREASEVAEGLGRFWEANAWADQLLKLDSDSNWGRATIKRLHDRLKDPPPPRTVSPYSQELEAALAKYPLPEKDEEHPLSEKSQPSAADIGNSLSFREDAAAIGVDFRYVNGSDQHGDDIRLIETMGGGVAVLDFDGDNWPDIYFPQGGLLSPSAASATGPSDKLFRNSADGRFVDVTTAANLGDSDYGQGVTIGDYDNDGFSDLYVANVGTNRLYHNNGDGTFTEVTRTLPQQSERCTTSCLLADLNGDGWPDLFDVTYVANADLGRSICHRGGELVGCNPGRFRAGYDRLCLGMGDGTFRDVSQEAGLLVPDGMGLGIVAADFEGNGRLGLFIANDAFPSFFFQNVSESMGGIPRYSEQGALVGLAVDGNGHVRACMGIAAGDANGDGLLDLFVTNFLHESNTLHIQNPPGVFHDETARFGLREPSLSKLGFGTQFLDIDRDGALDLVVANGHVYDLSAQGTPYRMRPQVFRNLGAGARFREETSAGPYFEQLSLGRGLARFDWNRDGLDDFVVSHLDSPAAVLTNTTQSPGHFLAVHLSGRIGSRDAVGAIVEVKAERQTVVRQITAGDGYKACNQRRLLFGLGADDQPVELLVRWPGGRVSTYSQVSIDREILLIEGSTSIIPLKND